MVMEERGTVTRTTASKVGTVNKERMLHIRLDAELHRRLRLIVAARDTTMQDWVSKALASAADNADGKKS
jgi:predicted HicB family RNase H-like nuclease